MSEINLDEVILPATEEEPETTMTEEIAKIPGDEDGWWKSYSEMQYRDCARRMLATGMEPGAVLSVLHTCYWAAANCFGS